MPYYLEEQYINLLTDFGFKRVFGTEPNKQLLSDFLNTLLPEKHQIQSLTFRTTEQLGNTPVDRKAIFDIYCQDASGDRFIVEIQKAKQNFFKDRSVYYSTFPIQEQSLQGPWNYELMPVYTVGVLDFVFDDHKDDPNLIHVVELKDQNCNVFYEKLKFIYIELPKFKKTIDQLETHLDKWLYLLRHLPELKETPEPLQEDIFNQLLEVARIANFSSIEEASYHNSLKYFRDMNNVVDTSRQEGVDEGLVKGREEGREEERLLNLERQRSLILRLLSRQLGEIPPIEQQQIQQQINQLSSEALSALNESLFDFLDVTDVKNWIQQYLENSA
jgi:predicted transposase/invertase (TIGR01784 family)